MQNLLECIGLIFNLITFFITIIAFLFTKQNFRLKFILICLAIGCKFLSIIFYALININVSVASICTIFILAFDGLILLVILNKQKSNKN